MSAKRQTPPTNIAHRRLANASDPRLERGSDGIGEQPDHLESFGGEIQGFCQAGASQNWSVKHCYFNRIVIVPSGYAKLSLREENVPPMPCLRSILCVLLL